MKWIALKTKEMRGYNRNKKRMETKAEERKGSEIKKKVSTRGHGLFSSFCKKNEAFRLILLVKKP